MAIKPLEENSGAIGDGLKRTAERVKTSPAGERSSWLANALTVILFVVTGVIAFGDIEVNIKSTVELTLMTLFIYTVTTVVHHNKYDAGMLKGKKTSEYKDANARYEEARSEVYSKRLATLMPELCVRYVKTELENYRRAIIAETYITWDDYIKKYQRMSKKELLKDDELTPEAARAIAKANAAKPIKLNAVQLMNAESTARRRLDILGVSPMQKAKIDKGINSVTRIFTTFLGCVMAVSIIVEPTWSNFALWCSRIAPVIIGYILGENAGFTTTAIAAPMYLDGKTEKIKAILEWNERGELEEMKRDETDRESGIDLGEEVRRRAAAEGGERIWQKE